MRDLAKQFVGKLEGWSFDTFLELVAYAALGVPADRELVNKLRPVTSLLPPQSINPLTVEVLRRKVPASDTRAEWDPTRFEALGRLRAMSKPKFDDETVLAIWPARTKQDLSIRRTRFRDTYQAYKLVGMTDRLWMLAERLPGFDVISVINILNSEFILTDQHCAFSWFDFMDKLGAFASDIAHYGAVVKVVHDLTKKFPVRGFPKFLVQECGVMSGFRNPPFPGFDVVAETRKLAEGGGERGLTANGSIDVFTRLADETLDTEGSPVEWKGFRDYVVSGDWETSGSSSVGRVEWEFNGEKGDFKARKNLVPDVVDLNRLAEEAYDAKNQDNKAIIKSELGKVRMAVASDMLMYLKMSWLLRLCGGGYLKWEGSTIEEDVFEQTDRMIKMLEMIHKAWNLPFDYAAFDHQPNTDELKAIVRVLVRMARRNVSVDNLLEFDKIADDVVNSFDHSTLSVVDPQGGRHTFRVTGGVMSGLRLTTVLGNGWNTIMTNWVKRVLDSLLVKLPGLGRYIRGDDSAIRNDQYAESLLFRLGYEALGAKGSDGKFGILYGETEFLRTWYDQDGCHGYPARAIPGLQQRKPWSSAPWEDESTMKHVYDTVQILRRRGCPEVRCTAWWRACKIVWSQRLHLSQDWLQVPRALGGLGVEPWDGHTFVVGKWPRLETDSIRVLNQTGWRATQLETKFAPFLPISRPEAETLAGRMVAKKIASDDVPSVNSALHQARQRPERSVFYKLDCEWNAPLTNALITQGRILQTAPASRGYLQLVLGEELASSWGKYGYLKQRWADVSEVFRLRRDSGVMRYFRANHTDFGFDVARLERRGLARFESLGWLFGDLSFNVTHSLHPALTGLLTRSVVLVLTGAIAKMKLRPRLLTQLGAQASTYLEAWLRDSALARVVYSW